MLGKSCGPLTLWSHLRHYPLTEELFRSGRFAARIDNLKIIKMSNTVSADKVLKLLNTPTNRKHTFIHWTGDYHVAKQLLMTLKRRIDMKGVGNTPQPAVQTFNSYRLQKRV